MAFEVDRLHRLISSRAEDEGPSNVFKISSQSLETDQVFSRSCSPQGSLLHAHCPAGFLYSSRGFDQRCEANSLRLESSSCTTETESDEDDELLESLAQQIAQSMLDEEETKVDVGVGVPKGNLYSENRDLPNIDLNEGRVSPSSWSCGSCSSGLIHSGSQSSSKVSSRVSSQVSSPSSAPSSGYQDAWDTLYAAAGEVVRLKMNEEKIAPVYSSERPSHTKVLNQALRAHMPQQTRSSGQAPGRSSPLHSARRKEENFMVNNQSQQNWVSKCAVMNAMVSPGRFQYPHYQRHQQAFNLDGQHGVNNYRHPGKLVDSKTLQRNRQAVLNGGSGVRVVFLGAPSGRESGGTGVFLPRTFAGGFEHKKRNEVAPLNTPVHGLITAMPMHTKSPREGVWPTLQQSMNRSNLRQPVVHEPFLPTEWTY